MAFGKLLNGLLFYIEPTQQPPRGVGTILAILTVRPATNESSEHNRM